MLAQLELLCIALGLGLLVGLQREHIGSKPAGLRTFALLTLLGTMSAMLDRLHQSGGWLVGFCLLGVVGVMIAAKLVRQRPEDVRYGITTEVALLLMFVVGAYLVSGERLTAVALTVAIALLLQLKPELHSFARRLGDEDIKAILQFALFSGIILPVLPNEGYGPFGVLNPFNIWLMVVLIVGISVGGYIAYKFYGERAGILLGGILGGAISSTATTVSYARRCATAPEAARLSALVIMISSTIVFVRVLIEIAVVAPASFLQLGLKVIAMLAAALLATLFAWLRVRKHPMQMPAQSNPSDVKSALIFAALYSLVLIGLAAAEHYYSEQGTYAVAFLAGLTDMDAITLSTARLVQQDGGESTLSVTQGSRLILIAAVSNLMFKLGIATLIGRRQLGWRLALLFAIPIATGIVLVVY